MKPAGLPVTVFVTRSKPVGAAVTLNGVDPEHVCPATVVLAVTVAFPVALGIPDTAPVPALTFMPVGNPAALHV